jgi:hypothetical protein
MNLKSDIGIDMGNADNLERSLISRSVESMQMEDIGWIPVGSSTSSDAVNCLSNVRRASATAKKVAPTPLIVRGKELRNSYILGSGVNVRVTSETKKGDKKRVQKLPSLLSLSFLQSIIDAQVDEGNAFARYFTTSQRVSLVPLKRIAGIVTDEDDPAFIRYVRISEPTGMNPNDDRYVITKDYLRTHPDVPDFLNDETLGRPVKVDRESIMHILPRNPDVGMPLGTPLGYGCALWAMGYYEYLAGSMDLSKALTSIAWKMQVSNERVGKSMATTIDSSSMHGNTGIMSQDMTLSGMGVPSAQVNFNNGRPVAGMVAAMFGVPLAGLLSDVGTSGTNNSLETLDTPMIKGFELKRALLRDFMLDIYDTMMSNVNVEVTFPPIIMDTEWNDVNSAVNAQKAGVLSRAETRKYTSKMLGVELMADKVPTYSDYQNSAYMQQQQADKSAEKTQKTQADAAQAGEEAGEDQKGVPKDDGE